MSVPLKPWSPSRTEPWDKKRASHLFNRVGFGGTPSEITAALKLPVAKVVEPFVNYEQTTDNWPTPAWAVPLGLTPQEFRRLSPEQRKELQKQNREHVEELKISWVRRMVETSRPLQEKMTLFWHGHFTSSFEEVKSAFLMWQQNELFRKHATGNFKTLALAVCSDPAMCHYLDTNTNRKEHPNENFARELMELFTMGEGNYTEDDVKEAARAFTGWGVENEHFKFRPPQHDGGVKKFLGHEGAFDGADIVNVIFEQPVTARFICRKLWQFFAYENPEKEIVEGLAEVLRRNNYELKPVLAAMFASEAFFSPRVIATQIKSPIQLVVGSMRLLQATVRPERQISGSLRLMGQDLFYPPNVKGWDGGQAWINTSTLLVRYNFANALVTGALPQANDTGKKREQQPARLAVTNATEHILERGQKLSAEALVDRLSDALLQTPLPDAQRKELVEFAAKPNGDKTVLLDLDTLENSKKIKTLINLIMSSAAYQVC